MRLIGGADLLTLLVLSLPVASIAWTVTHEDLFREFHDNCLKRSERSRHVAARKFFYLFTCEYCFSHYVTAAALIITRYHLLFADWRGYLIAFFSLIFVANIYMNAYNRMRVDITVVKKKAEAKTKEIEKLEIAILDDQ